MAHLRSFITVCEACMRKRATKELFNSRNAPCGKFCGNCAKSKLAILKRIEEGWPEKV